MIVATLHMTFPGADIVAVADGNEAVAVHRQRNADLVVLDLQMPTMGAHDAAPIIRSMSSDVSIIVATGVGGALDWQKLFRIGVDAFMVKPIQPADVAATAKRLLCAGRLTVALDGVTP